MTDDAKGARPTKFANESKIALKAYVDNSPNYCVSVSEFEKKAVYLAKVDQRKRNGDFVPIATVSRTTFSRIHKKLGLWSKNSDRQQMQGPRQLQMFAILYPLPLHSYPCRIWCRRS